MATLRQEIALARRELRSIRSQALSRRAPDDLDARRAALLASVPMSQEEGAQGLWQGLEQHTHHPGQAALMRDGTRWLAVGCGRRSGKSEVIRRKLLYTATDPDKPGRHYVIGGPTHDQNKRMHWWPLLRIGKPFIQHVAASTLTVTLHNGSTIQVAGLDKPQRVEGVAIDGIVLDEYGDMKPEVWEHHLRPALSTIGREGFAWFTGTPEPNHWRELYRLAEERDGWVTYHWTSEEVLAPEEIAEAKATMDLATYRREYLASWEDFGDRAYYAFDRATHVQPCTYDPTAPLCFAFDFNVSPGTATVFQEQVDHEGRKDLHRGFTAVLGEVWIKENSNTEMVCRQIVRDWSHHEGYVEVYGDPAGGSRSTKGTKGTDWDIVREELGKRWGRMSVRVDSADPGHRARINAVNRRLRTADGAVSMLIDPECKRTIEDFEAVKVKPDGSLDKSDDRYSHLTDGIAYFCARVHGGRGRAPRIRRIV